MRPRSALLRRKGGLHTMAWKPPCGNAALSSGSCNCPKSATSSCTLSCARRRPSASTQFCLAPSKASSSRSNPTALARPRKGSSRQPLPQSAASMRAPEPQPRSRMRGWLPSSDAAAVAACTQACTTHSEEERGVSCVRPTRRETPRKSTRVSTLASALIEPVAMASASAAAAACRAAWRASRLRVFMNLAGGSIRKVVVASSPLSAARAGGRITDANAK
mmetsp:Transcript_1021/g.2707  ORF Transcript_1021/g.2707 Transcript_1021/m.2707 type:complete len:220 (+) Transcript_1021:240-899(+)